MCTSWTLFVVNYKIYFSPLCNKCVYRYDSHSNWLGNCIGNDNQVYYMLFITFSFIINTDLFFILLNYLLWVKDFNFKILMLVVYFIFQIPFSIVSYIYFFEFIESTIYFYLDIFYNITTAESEYYRNCYYFK